MNELIIDYRHKKGRIKPLHGVGNGPLSRGNTIDISKYFKMISPPFARLHDTGFPESREVDVHTIFRDFSKDADNPENYDFFLTDKYLKAILDLGTDIIYRLGETIATADRRIYVNPPEDNEKYARICVNIIRHYNDGWADGHNYGINYWEIWNEPSVDNMWTGNTKEWLELYGAVFKAIKDYDSELMIGGPVACEPNSIIHYPFLDYVTEKKLIPDFYSFHCYTSSMEHAKYYLDSMYEKLEEYNLTQLPAFITEWNYVPRGDDGRVFWEIPRSEKLDLFHRMVSAEGAAHTAMFLGLLQDSFVEEANYYAMHVDGLFSCFSKYGVPEKPFFSLVAFKHIYDLGNQIVVNGNETLSESYCVASGNEGRCRILISNLKNDDSHFKIKIQGFDYSKASLRIIDDVSDLDSGCLNESDPGIFELQVPLGTVVLIEVSR